MFSWFIFAQSEPDGWLKAIGILVLIGLSSLGGLGQWIRNRAAEKEERRKAEQRAATPQASGGQAVSTPRAARPVAQPLPPGASVGRARPTQPVARPLPPRAGQTTASTPPRARALPAAAEILVGFESLLQPEPEPTMTPPPPVRSEHPRRPTPGRRRASKPAPPPAPDAREGVRLVEDVKEKQQEVEAAPVLTAADFARLDLAALRRAIVLNEILGPPRALKPLDD